MMEIEILHIQESFILLDDSMSYEEIMEAKRRLRNVIASIKAPARWWRDIFPGSMVPGKCDLVGKLTKEIRPINYYDLQNNDSVKCVNIAEVMDAQEAINNVKCIYMRRKSDKLLDLMLELVPGCYVYSSTATMNYCFLRDVYQKHCENIPGMYDKDEWYAFCRWIESLPNSNLITDGLLTDKLKKRIRLHEQQQKNH